MESKVYHRLKNKTVRDLYWVLFSDSPLSADYDLSPYSLFPQAIIEEWKTGSVNYFLDLDNNVQDLVHFVNRKKNKRLGFYAEALLSYFFQTFDKVELLLQNFQIIDDLRTIGEIDFIIRYNQKVIHIECAVKYYLLLNSKKSNNSSEWVGPRLRDNLELKVHKIIKHQLPLGSREEVLNKLDLTIDSSYLFLKGIFFSEEKIDADIINKNKTNQFVRQSNLLKLKQKPIEILNRPNWLSATLPIQKDVNSSIIDFEPLLTTPEMVLFDDGNVRFVVADDWGRD